MAEQVTTTHNDYANKNPEPVKTWLLVLSVCMVIATGVVSVAIINLANSFAELFRGFGADLPFLTELMIEYNRVSIIPAVGALIAAGLFFRERKSHSVDANTFFTWVTVCFGLSLFLLAVAVVGAYLPIFKLGATV